MTRFQKIFQILDTIASAEPRCTFAPNATDASGNCSGDSSTLGAALNVPKSGTYENVRRQTI